jgi:hypothetical protein
VHDCTGSRLTNNHDVETESFSDTLAVPLVWQIGESDETGQLPAHNVRHVACCGSGSLGISVGDSLDLRRYGTHQRRGRAVIRRDLRRDWRCADRGRRRRDAVGSCVDELCISIIHGRLVGIGSWICVCRLCLRRRCAFFGSSAHGDRRRSDAARDAARGNEGCGLRELDFELLWQWSFVPSSVGRARVSNMHMETFVCAEQVCGGRSVHCGGCPTQVNSSLAAGIGTSQIRLNSPTYRPIVGDDITSMIREAIDEGESHGRVKATRWRSELWREGTANCSSQTAAERGLWARASREDGESTRRSVTLLTICLYHTGNNILRYLTLPPDLFIDQV